MLRTADVVGASALDVLGLPARPDGLAAILRPVISAVAQFAPTGLRVTTSGSAASRAAAWVATTKPSTAPTEAA